MTWVAQVSRIASVRSFRPAGVSRCPAFFPASPWPQERLSDRQVLHAMGSFYAQVERATESTVSAQLCARRGLLTLPPCDTIQVEGIFLLCQSLFELSLVYNAAARLPDVYRLAPHLAAMTPFPVHCKSLLQGLAPLQWSGGKAFSIYKGSGPASELQSWRSSILLEPESKAIQNAFRPGFLCGGRAESACWAAWWLSRPYIGHGLFPCKGPISCT